MKINRKTVWTISGSTFLLLVVLFFRWQPDAQLERRWQGFLDSFETRNWSAVDAYLSPDYRDGWGQTRRQLKRNATFALRDFQSLQVTGTDVSISRRGREAEILAVIRIVGNGGPRADQARRTINTVYTPTRFRWSRTNWRPWDWRLVSVENPEMDLPAAYRDLLDSPL